LSKNIPRIRIPGFRKSIYLLDPLKEFTRTVRNCFAAHEEEIGDAIEQDPEYYAQELVSPGADIYLFSEAKGYADIAGLFSRLIFTTYDKQ
jgi:hypothetical protein